MKVQFDFFAQLESAAGASSLSVEASEPTVTSALEALRAQAPAGLAGLLFAECGELHPWVRVVRDDAIISIDAPLDEEVVLRLISPVGGG